jgi:hypothetical protein
VNQSQELELWVGVVRWSCQENATRGYFTAHNISILDFTAPKQKEDSSWRVEKKERFVSHVGSKLE